MTIGYAPLIRPEQWSNAQVVTFDAGPDGCWAHADWRGSALVCTDPAHVCDSQPFKDCPLGLCRAHHVMICEASPLALELVRGADGPECPPGSVNSTFVMEDGDQNSP